MTADVPVVFVNLDDLRSLMAEHRALRAELEALGLVRREGVGELRANREHLAAVRHSLGYLTPAPPSPPAQAD
jgi:hypothetical protein